MSVVVEPWTIIKHGPVYDVSGRGRRVMVWSVTSITGPLSGLDAIPSENLKKAAAFGIAVHKATAMLDLGQRWLDLDPLLSPAVEAWKKFKRDHDVKILAVEKSVFSEKNLYAGTFDRVGLVDGVPSIIEIKTRKLNTISDPLQTAAYLEARNEMCREKNVGRVVVQLGTGDDYVASKLQERKAGDHFRVFLGALALHNWKKSNGGIV